MASAQTTLPTRPEAPPATSGSAHDIVAQMATGHHLTLAYWLSGILAAVALVASAIGVFYPDIFRDTAVTAGNARGTDLVILVVAIPALVIAMALTARGSLRAQIVWLGALGYILYNAIFFAFA